MNLDNSGGWAIARFAAQPATRLRLLARISLLCAMKKNEPLPFVAGPTEPPLVKNVETVLLRIANQRFAFHIQVEVHKLPPNPGTLHSFPSPKE